jgi:hypothetical protein
MKRGTKANPRDDARHLTLIGCSTTPQTAATPSSHPPADSSHPQSTSIPLYIVASISCFCNSKIKLVFWSCNRFCVGCSNAFPRYSRCGASSKRHRCLDSPASGSSADRSKSIFEHMATECAPGAMEQMAHVLDRCRSKLPTFSATALYQATLGTVLTSSV